MMLGPVNQVAIPINQVTSPINQVSSPKNQVSSPKNQVSSFAPTLFSFYLGLSALQSGWLEPCTYFQFTYCQEIPDDLDSDTQQGPQHFTTSATRSDRERASCRETVYFPVNCGLKNNKIINELTKKQNPTKGLDKVEDSTGRINNITKTLQGNNITINNRTRDKIGHLAHKNTTFGIKKP